MSDTNRLVYNYARRQDFSPTLSTTVLSLSFSSTWQVDNCSGSLLIGMNVKKQHLRKVRKLPSQTGHRYQVEMVIDEEQYKKLQAGNPFKDLEIGGEWEEG